MHEEITEKERKEIIKEYHEASGHGGVNTIKFLINARYKWKYMHREIKEYADKCTSYLTSERSKHQY